MPSIAVAFESGASARLGLSLTLGFRVLDNRKVRPRLEMNLGCRLPSSGFSALGLRENELHLVLNSQA